MSETVAVEIIKTIPAALWVGFAVLVFVMLRPALLRQVDRLTNVRTPGVELSFAEKLMDEAAVHQDEGVQPPASDKRAAISRLDHAAELMAGGRILWVDDNPKWNEPLIRLVREVGMTVEPVRTTSEALAALRQRSYDLVITDMVRHTEEPAETAGLTLIDTLEREGVELPIIMLTARFDPEQVIHPRLFASTDRIDELVQYVIDLMERIRFGAVSKRSPDWSTNGDWPQEQLARFADGESNIHPTIVGMLDLLSDRPGTRIPLSSVAAHLGITKQVLRGRLAALTRHLKANYEFGRLGWPMQWEFQYNADGSQETHYYMSADQAERWRAVRRR